MHHVNALCFNGNAGNLVPDCKCGSTIKVYQNNMPSFFEWTIATDSKGEFPTIKLTGF